MSDDQLYVAEIETGLGEIRNFMYKNQLGEVPNHTAETLASAFGGQVLSVLPAAGFITGGLMCEIVRA